MILLHFFVHQCLRHDINTLFLLKHQQVLQMFKLAANYKKASMMAVFLLALMAIPMCAMAVNAGAVATCTVTVEKDNAVVEGASVTLYESTRQYWGLWYSRGDVVAANITASDGTCTFSNLDDTKYYQAVIIVGQTQYQVNFLGDDTVTLQLGYTAQLRGEFYIGAFAAVLVIIGLIAFGWIRFTHRAPVVIGTQ